MPKKHDDKNFHLLPKLWLGHKPWKHFQSLLYQVVWSQQTPPCNEKFHFAKDPAFYGEQIGSWRDKPGWNQKKINNSGDWIHIIRNIYPNKTVHFCSKENKWMYNHQISYLHIHLPKGPLFLNPDGKLRSWNFSNISNTLTNIFHNSTWVPVNYTPHPDPKGEPHEVVRQRIWLHCRVEAQLYWKGKKFSNGVCRVIIDWHNKPIST